MVQQTKYLTNSDLLNLSRSKARKLLPTDKALAKSQPSEADIATIIAASILLPMLAISIEIALL